MFFNGANVRQVDVPTQTGAFGILAAHVPTLQVLRPGLVVVHAEDGTISKYFGESIGRAEGRGWVRDACLNGLVLVSVGSVRKLTKDIELPGTGLGVVRDVSGQQWAWRGPIRGERILSSEEVFHSLAPAVQPRLEPSSGSPLTLAPLLGRWAKGGGSVPMSSLQWMHLVAPVHLCAGAFGIWSHAVWSLSWPCRGSGADLCPHARTWTSHSPSSRSEQWLGHSER